MSYCNIWFCKEKQSLPVHIRDGNLYIFNYFFFASVGAVTENVQLSQFIVEYIIIQLLYLKDKCIGPLSQFIVEYIIIQMLYLKDKCIGPLSWLSQKGRVVPR